MPAAGETIIAGRVPGERIATQIDTSDTSGFTTTETVLTTVTAPLVSGRTYRVRFVSLIRSTVADDDINARIRQDNVTGTEVFVSQFEINTNTSLGVVVIIEAEYTATATADKTFVATGVRTTGSGTITARGAAAAPRQLYVDYIRG